MNDYFYDSRRLENMIAGQSSPPFRSGRAWGASSLPSAWSVDESKRQHSGTHLSLDCCDPHNL